MLADLEERPSPPISYNSPISRQNNNKSNTLGQLTQTFVKLIQSAKDQRIQIDEASKKLNIQKRRIYDITNVLEGIGYIQKIGKNQMKWVGGQRGNELEHEAQQLEKQHEAIEMQTKKVENEIQNLKEQLKALSKQNNDCNYLKLKDIQTVMESLRVNQILLYSGKIGDHLQNDSNPEKKTSQCTIQSHASQTKLFFCKLQGQNIIEIQQNICNLTKESPIHEIPEINRNDFFRGYDIYEEEQDRSEATPQIFFDEFNLNLPIQHPFENMSERSRVKEQFFQSDQSE